MHTSARSKINASSKQGVKTAVLLWQQRADNNPARWLPGLVREHEFHGIQAAEDGEADGR